MTGNNICGSERQGLSIPPYTPTSAPPPSVCKIDQVCRATPTSLASCHTVIYLPTVGRCTSSCPVAIATTWALTPRKKRWLQTSGRGQLHGDPYPQRLLHLHCGLLPLPWQHHHPGLMGSDHQLPHQKTARQMMFFLRQLSKINLPIKMLV